MRDGSFVAREWHATATPVGAAQYAAYVRDKLIPALHARVGFVALYLLTSPRNDDTIELVVVTMWQSTDAVRAFAGDDPTRAVVEDEAQPFLAAFDRHVRLHDVITAFPGFGGENAP